MYITRIDILTPSSLEIVHMLQTHMPDNIELTFLYLCSSISCTHTRTRGHMYTTIKVCLCTHIHMYMYMYCTLTCKHN